MTETTNDDWRDHLSSLDNELRSDLRQQGERLAGVEAGITNLGRSFDHFSRSYEEHARSQREANKTQWPIVFSVLGLVAVVAGGFLSGYLRDLERIEGNVVAIDTKLETRVSDEDPGQDIRLRDLESEVVGIRANEHITFAKDAENAAAVATVAELKREFINHARDGHPERIEQMLVDRMERFKDYKEDIRMEITRELTLRDEIRDEIHKRLDLVEKRWAEEHAGGAHHE